jgi:hypothetical protein
VTPAILPNCLSRGVATADAIVSGLAPGRFAFTDIVGKSTCGSGETGNSVKAITPESAKAIVNRDVPTGRFMKGAEMFILVSRLHIGSISDWKCPARVLESTR